MRLGSLLRLAVHEFRAGLRSGGTVTVLLFVCLVGFVSCAPPGTSAVLAGFRAWRQGALLLGLLAVALVAGAARRDDRCGAHEIIGTRAFPAERLLAARFAGTLALVYVLYIAEVLASALGAATSGGGGLNLLAIGHALERGAAPLLFVAAATYALTWALRSEIVGGIVALYILAVVMAAEYLSPVFDYSLSQNAATYTCLALAFIGLSMAAARRRQAVEVPRTRVLAVVATCLLLAGLLNAVRTVRASYDSQLHRDPLTVVMASQYYEGIQRRGPSRAPGFWLPDQHGRLFRFSKTDGARRLVLFWSPHVPESLQTLQALAHVLREDPEAARVIAICVANDHWVNGQLAAEVRAPFPMVADPSTRYMGAVENCSAIAEAWDVHTLPQLYVLDEDRRAWPPGAGTALRSPEEVRAAAAYQQPLSGPGGGRPWR